MYYAPHQSPNRLRVHFSRTFWKKLSYGILFWAYFSFTSRISGRFGNSKTFGQILKISAFQNRAQRITWREILLLKLFTGNRPNKTTFQKKVFAVRFSKHTVEVGSNAFLLIFSKPHPGVKKRSSLWKIKEKSFRPVFGLLSCHHSLPTNQEVCCGLY